MMERSLHLANRLENVGGIRYRQQAAQELRRLHEVNQGLLEALKGLVDLAHEAGFPCDKAEAAIAKAIGVAS